MKKVTEIDTCWLCPHHGYLNARVYCSKSQKLLENQFRDDGQLLPKWCRQPIPKWCRLPNADCDGVKILHDRYIGDGPDRKASLQQARFEDWWKRKWEDKEIPDDSIISGISAHEIAKDAWEEGSRSKVCCKIIKEVFKLVEDLAQKRKEITMGE